MEINRRNILLGIGFALLLVVIWQWIAGWGLVTVQVSDKPLADIIRSIERQGGVKIVTNADAATKVTMDVYRVPAVEAIDVLAARIDGNWTVGYVAGPKKADVTAGIAALQQGERNRDFRTFGMGFGGFGGGGMMDSSAPIDSRLVVWKVSASDTPQLQAYLEQLSFKTGLFASVPQSWNPDVAKVPAGGKAADALRSIVKSVGGTWQEIFVLRVSNWDRVADGGRDQGNQPPPPAGGPPGGGGFGGPRPGGGGPRGDGGPRAEWMQDRAEARIAQLPKEQQEQAKKDFDDMRAFWDKIRELPEDQRRAAAEQFFNSPAVQERMAERMAARDEKMGPEKRADRARDYIQRKQQIKQQQANQN